MQKRKIVAIAGVTLLSAAFLSACGNSSSKSETSSTYSYVYTEDPTSLDYIAYNRQQVSDIVTNMVDGLLENDKYGNLVPSLAEDWKVSKDGLTYTYTLRKGVKWYTAEGEEYADVTANDFVTSLKHAVETKSEGLYIIQNSIKGLDDYVTGKTKDFSTVGVKAVDDHTVQYTLNQPESFWNSKLTMSIMLPLNADFLASKGKDFGKVSPDGILYNGAYRISAMTSKSSLEYTKNENYWDADNVKIDNVKLTYYGGDDPESLIKGFTDGNYSNARVFPNSSSYKSVKEKYKDNITYGLQDATTYYTVLNVNRGNYAHTSKTTDAQKTASQKALQNKDFRQAIAFGFDRQTYLAQSVGEDASDKALRNTFVPPTFVSAGSTSFGDLVTKDLVSYGDQWKDIDLSDAQNGLYKPEKAKAEIAKAKEALTAQGVEFPIHLDMAVNQSSEISVQQASSLKQSIEKSLGTDNVVIDLQMMDTDTFQNAAFYAEGAAQMDYDISYAGWGPDYQDPSTYLDVFNTKNGASLERLGLNGEKDTALIQEIGLDKYDALLKEASAETQDVAARYEKYAKAQAWLTDSALVIPYMSLGGTPGVSKVVPYTASTADIGIKGGGSFFKYMEVGTKVNNAKDVYKKREKWLKEKAKSNAKAQEELADHVEK
ncbi:peptide ABC transporter substrate-binding protein [Streptococcus gallinaceus]|uniref:Oligopeptide transport system substrate-binding protein n=1 Tax=Streptococcus gallinaceus TaxID=165758 RepID=A0ABV2JMQ4_9STRE|nr:peptide ABC transporter substrate-binding protein [Streptococcus gallinaceus]MCP1640010.1 oligopeptide transport system substrate-binding protein [Streptococcus gallinaceus]MCP1770792.1 oligopeptide transport system substrate-binding protein [Streptococcus gallinaceus]